MKISKQLARRTGCGEGGCCCSILFDIPINMTKDVQPLLQPFNIILYLCIQLLFADNQLMV